MVVVRWKKTYRQITNLQPCTESPPLAPPWCFVFASRRHGPPACSGAVDFATRRRHPFYPGRIRREIKRFHPPGKTGRSGGAKNRKTLVYQGIPGCGKIKSGGNIKTVPFMLPLSRIKRQVYILSLIKTKKEAGPVRLPVRDGHRPAVRIQSCRTAVWSPPLPARNVKR